MKLLITLMLCTLPFATIELESRALLDGKIDMLLPKDFRWMTEEERNLKYSHTPNSPKWVLTNEELNVNLAFTHTAASVDDATLPLIHEKIKQSMQDAYPNAEWKGDGITTLNGKTFGYIKLIAERADKTYNYLLMTEVDGRLLILSFNCAERLLGEWEETAEKMMQSVKVREE
jgi:hypothetical protein